MHLVNIRRYLYSIIFYKLVCRSDILCYSRCNLQFSCQSSILVDEKQGQDFHLPKFSYISLIQNHRSNAPLSITVNLLIRDRVTYNHIIHIADSKRQKV